MNTILITGGSGKIGFQFVRHFLETGFLVVTTTTGKQKFQEKLKSGFPALKLKNLEILEVDFAHKNALSQISGFLNKKQIEINHLVHNARSARFLSIEEDLMVSEENFAGEFYTDVIFPYRLTMALLKTQTSLKNVVFITSMYGVVAPNPSLYENFDASSPIQYGVSKAAQIHLTKELAVRLAPEIRVNCISYGGIKGRVDADFEERYKKLTPQARMLAEEDVIGPLAFLISKNSKNMTGQNIKVDGGWTIW